MTTPSQYQQFLETEANKAVIMSNIRNGRVNVMGAPPASRFSYPFYEEKNPSIDSFYKEAVKGILLPNQLQTVFFSPSNINSLQNAIQYYVNQRSNGQFKIGRQSDNELEIVMRSVYLQYGKNRDSDIKTQVKELNSYVLEYAVENILSNVRQYLVYKKDISQLPMPLDLPVFSTSAGTRTSPNFAI